MGRLNVLKVSDIKGDQTQSINQSPIKLSAICMSPVELPYVPILLDETFTKALWDTGAEKSFISEETNKPQENRTERVNRDLVQMIANYVNEQHGTWDQFLREFAYAIRTDVNETTGKTPVELFLGRKLITHFQKLVMVSDGTEFAVGDIERLFEEARRNTETKHEKWKKYYRRRRDVQIKVNDWVLVATHPLSSATRRKVVAKFKPKFEGPYRVLDVKNNNVVIWKAGKRLTINVDQVRIYRHRKCDETEIGTGSSDNGNLRDKSSGFDRIQRRSNDSRDGKKKGSEVKRELEEKGLSYRNNQGEKHPNKTNKRGPLIRSIPSSWSDKGRMIKKSKNQKLGYKRANESKSGGPERKVRKGSEHRVPKINLSSNDTNSVLPRLRKKNRREETRGRHNKEDQFDPEMAEKGTIVHTSKSEQDQTTRVPDEEVINNGKTRKGEERVQRNPCHWRSCVVPARISSQSSRHCCRLPLPHASALIQRYFGCVLGYSRPNSFHTLPKLIWCGSWRCNLGQLLSNHGPLLSAKDPEREPARETIQSGD
ncbi:uncharacterized protein TNCV_1125281 [Trichonephila clavipes]|nr:uncharacterized protein TNCV_1125281 [Trichonephila clavipes]